MSIIQAHNLEVSIQDTPILKQVSFQIGAGTLVGIIGPNGSGKSTLLRTISGILPYEGQLNLLETSINQWDKKKLARHLAVLPQNPSISFDFKVRDYVMLGRMPHKGWLEGENQFDQDQVAQVLRELDLEGMSARLLPSLSGGERQRVLLAQALVQDTDILLLDEPTSHLDIYHQFDLLKRIRQLADAGKTIVVVFHDLSLAARFTDELLVLKEGRLVTHGPTTDVLDKALIKDVFRMSVSLTNSSDSTPQIYFHDQA